MFSEFFDRPTAPCFEGLHVRWEASLTGLGRRCPLAGEPNALLWGVCPQASALKDIAGNLRGVAVELIWDIGILALDFRLTLHFPSSVSCF